MKTQEIKSINPLSVAKLCGLMYVIIGLVLGLIVGLVSLPSTLIVNVTGVPTILIGIFFGLLLALFYGVLGFLIGAASAWLYNKVADKIGGIEIELK